MSDKKIGLEFAESFSRYPKASIELERKIKLSKAEKILESGAYQKTESAPLKRKELSFSKFASVEKL